MRKLTAITGLLFVVLANAEAQIATVNRDVLTGGYDNQRTNANLNETALTPQVVSNGSFGRLFSLPVQGQIYAQPLYRAHLSIAGGVHNVVFVATMHNNIYAFDADTPAAPLWSRNLGPSVPAGNYSSDFGPFTDISPEVGILSTPVIDPSSGTLYVVAATFENGSYYYRLHALNNATGAELAGSPVVISATVPGTGDSSDGTNVPFVAQQHLQRPALLLSQGTIYIAFGAHADAVPWHGWIIAYDAATLAYKAVFNTTPNGSGGSFWESGRGLNADAAGNIYAVSGNGDTDDVSSYSDSVLRLKPNLTVSDWFSPSDVQELNDTDDDLGSMGAILIPGTNYMVAGGKQGVMYLLQQNSLGHITSTDGQVAQVLNVTGFGNFNAALWAAASGPILYTHGAGDPVKAWKFNGSQFGQTPSSVSTITPPLMFQGMSVSANGGTAGTGILWVLDAVGNPTSDARLMAFDAGDVSKLLYDSMAHPGDDPGQFVKFVNPTVAAGKVYVPTASGALVVYGPGGGAKTTVPSITSVVNAAGFSGQQVSSGEMVLITGQNLGSSQLYSAKPNSGGQFPTVLGSTQVLFNGTPGELVYESANAVAAIVPATLTVGSNVTIAVVSQQTTSPAVSLPVIQSVPGVFTADGSGSGQASALNADGSPNSPTNPTIAGNQITIFVTGVSATDTVTAYVNGGSVPVLMVAATGIDALTEVVVQTPSSAAGGGEVEIAITVNGQTSQANVNVFVQ